MSRQMMSATPKFTVGQEVPILPIDTGAEVARVIAVIKMRSPKGFGYVIESSDDPHWAESSGLDYEENWDYSVWPEEWLVNKIEDNKEGK